MANNVNPEAWGVQFGLDTTTLLPPIDPVQAGMSLPHYDPETGLIQESRAARQVSEGLSIWQRVYASRR